MFDKSPLVSLAESYGLDAELMDARALTLALYHYHWTKLNHKFDTYSFYYCLCYDFSH